MKIEVHRHSGTPEDVPTASFRRAEHGDAETICLEPEGAARVVLREVFNAVTLITADGETLVVNMRDSGFECVYQCGDSIEPFALQRGEFLPDPRKFALLGYATNREMITELECRWRLGSTHPDYSTMTGEQFPTEEYTVGDCTVLATNAQVDPLQADNRPTIDMLCEIMHNAYEDAAVEAGWETQTASRKPWADVPEANKATMRVSVQALLDAL